MSSLPGSLMITRVGSFMRLLEPVLKHFSRADDRDVKDTLELMRIRRSLGWKWSKDKQTMLSVSIPNSMAFHPKMAKLGLETMSEEEKKDFVAAFKKSAPKLST